MDNNKNRMKDREKSNSELRKIDPTGNADVGIENGDDLIEDLAQALKGE